MDSSTVLPPLGLPLFIQKNPTHIIGVVVSPGPLAVVAEVPLLVDVEPVHHVGGEAAQVEAEHRGLRGRALADADCAVYVA